MQAAAPRICSQRTMCDGRFRSFSQCSAARTTSRRRAERQWGTSRDRSTSRPRSWGWNAGLLTLRDATINCWRSSVFSAISSRRDRRRSPATPVTNAKEPVARHHPAFTRAAARLTKARSRLQTAAITPTTMPQPAEPTRLVFPRIQVDPGADANGSQNTKQLSDVSLSLGYRVNEDSHGLDLVLEVQHGISIIDMDI